MIQCISFNLSRFLAYGATFVDLAFRFRMGASTVRLIVLQTIRAINKIFLPIAIPKTKTKDEWKEIAQGFLNRWNFPNCLGALDGKNCTQFAPRKSGSMYFNYMKTFSTNLMALVDAEYRFIMVDIGAYGSNADSTIFANSEFGRMYLEQPWALNIPNESPLPQQSSPVPYVIIADEGFALKASIMRPYPGQKLTQKQRIFNYR